jgi:hypothetical protein
MEPKEGVIHIGGRSLDQLIKDPNLPRYYANGFIVARAENDLFIMPTRNGDSTFLMNLSFASAKKLLQALQKNIQEIEATIGEVKAMPSIPQPVSKPNEK